ncbi:MAG: HPP family protein, partial [Candidatus Methanomethylophilaceae archaeon]|nr:HPP family protein [Candidatus Methanomethylophilaceae archaeon]
MDNPFKPSEDYDAMVLAVTLAAAFAALSILAYLDQSFADPYLVASFGATAVLIYGAPKAPFSKTKNVFFGHLFSAVIGVSVAMILDWAGALDDLRFLGVGIAGGVAIIVMMLTGTIHPPGGATAITCVMSGFCSPVFVVRPIMLGVVILRAIAYA